MLNKFEKKLVVKLLKDEDFNIDKTNCLDADEIEKWLFSLIDNKKEKNNKI